METSPRWRHRIGSAARLLRDATLPRRMRPEAKAALIPPQPDYDAILANPYITAKLLTPPQGDVLVLCHQPPATGSELPVPPNTFWEGYGPDEATYLESGREHVATMLDALSRAGAEPAGFERVLDFGCAAGRMLRWFPRADGAERWGCDIKNATIAWCQRYLSPPMQFVTTTTFPHLPFEDNSFDLVYSGGVFTHIIDLPDAWFLELRRLIRPGGYGYLTIFDKHALDLVLTPPDGAPRAPAWFAKQLRDFDDRTGAFGMDFAFFSVEEGPGWTGMPVPQVCYDIDYLTQKWSRLGDIVSVDQEAFAEQTAILFRKR